MKTFVFFLAVTFLVSFDAALGGITVTSTKGQTMNVEVLAYTASSRNVRIKRLPDGVIFNVKLDVFDAGSQEQIIVAAPKPKPKLDIKISSGARRTDFGAGGYMERQKITASMEVKNDSRDIDLAETKFTLLIVGRNTSRFADRNQDGAKILSSQTVTKSIAAGKTLKFECKPVFTEYDEDKDSSNLGGFDYDGYLLILQDKDGTVFEAKTSIGPVQKLLLKDMEGLKKAAEYKEGSVMERTLVQRPGLRTGLRP